MKIFQTNILSVRTAAYTALSSVRSWVIIITEMMKLKIALAVAVSTAGGYFLFAGRLSIEVLEPLLGVLLLAGGCCALNQVQEVRFDALMPRTSGRPIPSGKIKSLTGLWLALAAVLVGLALLGSAERHPVKTVLLGILAMFWYNGLYTYLKRITAFAAVVGAVIGGLGPMIGWAAAGGILTDPLILMVAGFCFIWQIPHFWLLLMLRGKEYERAGLCSLTQVFSPAQLGRVTYVWMVATATVGILLGLQARFNLLSLAVLTSSSAGLVLSVWGLGRSQKPQTLWAGRCFLIINCYGLLIMVLLVANSLAGR
jgi:protoheme IX farnesyltransferase